MSHNFYATLELENNCSQEDIDRAYKKLAMRYHPDRNPGDNASAEKFIQIQTAHDTLRDIAKRQQYDNSQNVPDFSFSNNEIFDTEDLDVRLICQISLHEAIVGTIKNIIIQRRVPCAKCSGNGFTQFKICLVCQGRGVAIRTLNGFFQFQAVCGNCSGKGQVGVSRCDGCNGSRYGKSIDSPIGLQIPKGIQNGMTLGINAQGHIGASGRIGNIYVECQLQENNDYKVQGLDIMHVFHAKFSTLLFGGMINIKTLEDETIEVEIPAGTKCNTKFRIKEKGLPDLRNNLMRGDLIATVFVDIPSIEINQVLKTILINNNI